MIELPQNIQELPLLPAHLWVISEKYKRQSSHPFLFNPNRAFLRLEKNENTTIQYQEIMQWFSVINEKTQKL